MSTDPDVPAEVLRWAEQAAQEISPLSKARWKTQVIAAAIMADRAARPEYREGLEAAAKVTDGFMFATQQAATEMSPKQMNDLILFSQRIAAAIRALAQKEG